MSDRRSSRPMIVTPPRVGDAIGSALRNAFRMPEGCAHDWDNVLRRIDSAELNRRG